MPTDDRGGSAPGRRRFLRSMGLSAGAALFSGLEALGAQEQPPATPARGGSRMRSRPDLLDAQSAPGIEVIQLTTETDVPSSHLYMEAQVFTPDSKRFVLHRSATAHGGSRHDPEHQYLLCDLEQDGALSPLTTETGVTAASVSPDGRWVYYFVDETEIAGGRLTLKRVRLDGTARETIQVVDTPLLGTEFRPSCLYPLSTISSDGRRIALSAFLGDGNTANAPWGLMVFDIEQATVALLIHGRSWCNMHPQYCRSTDPEESHDLLIQENHGNENDARGNNTLLVGGAGADIHVIRDDGAGPWTTVPGPDPVEDSRLLGPAAQFRDMPWGRDGNEACQGHQCWRGRSTWAVTSTGTNRPPEAQLIEGRAAPQAGHLGIATPGGVRNDLSREFPDPHFYHFGTDLEGRRLVSDAGPLSTEASIWAAEFGEPGRDPLRNFRYLLQPRSTCRSEAHIHPFLSPDGTLAFFNSDESGLLQAYMIRGL